MLMMEDVQRNHRTVIKIRKRVFSADYVPMEVFDKAWIRANAAPPKDNPELALD